MCGVIADMDSYPNARILLGVLQSYAPDGPALQRCAEIFSEMEISLRDDREMVSTLADLIKRGIDSGTWFWLVESSIPEQ